MLTAPTFGDPAPDGGRLANLLDPDSTRGFATLLGFRWLRLPLASADAPEGVTAREWFAHGTPIQVVLGVGRSDVLVAPAGPDVLRYETSDSEPGTLLLSDVSTNLSLLASAVQRAAARERARRLWCRLCGTLSTPRTGSDICVDCEDALAGTFYLSRELIHAPDELLAAVDRDDVNGLADELTSYVDVDVSIKEWEPTHLEIFADGLGIELKYPFTMAELWEAADQLSEWTLRE